MGKEENADVEFLTFCDDRSSVYFVTYFCLVLFCFLVNNNATEFC